MSFTSSVELKYQTNLELEGNQSLSIRNQSSKCFFPEVFCSDSACSHCFNTTLATCKECSYPGFVMFGFIVALLGFTIVVTNSLVLWQVVRKKNKGTYEKIKASLAVADILTGFQPLVISLYNLRWTMDSTANEFIRNVFQLTSSPQAITGLAFYMFGFSSSLYHLVFLSQQRVFAMRWPLKYRVQKPQTVYIGLGIVWILAILSAVAPAWFPDVIIFGYSTDIFMFSFGALSITPVIMIISIGYVFPFLVMNSFMIYSAILIRKIVAKSRRFAQRNGDRDALNKREASMFKTVALMQAGFLITLLPLGIEVMLNMFIYKTTSSGKSSHVSRLISYYLAMTNSLVNPLVYTICDKEFRKSIVQCFTSKQRLLNDSDYVLNSKQVAAASRLNRMVTERNATSNPT